jgi:Asp-tRNA(Asn)/Glu-tRNA(Gln) amidotransferase A subunit family amidase
MGHTFIFNLAGNPVVTMLIRFTKKGLPIGVQVGLRWQDPLLLNVAGQLFDAAGSFKPPIEYRKVP